MFRLLASLVAAAMLSLVSASIVRAQSAQAPAPARAETRPVLVNLNTATAADLEKLPGIGAKVAARIVEYRMKKGPFKKIEELMNVQGIGEKSFLKLRPQLTVAPAPDATAARQHP